MLRVDEKELEKELEEISQLGMIRKHEGGWLVVNFNKRQGATSSTERSKEFRQRERHQQYVGENQNENATNAQRFDLQKQKQNKNKNKKQNTETESESEPLPVVVNSTDVGSVFRSYENEIGLITPIIAEKIKDYIEGDKVNIKWIIDAIEIAAKQNKRSFSYAEAILKRWIAQGFQDLGGKRENGRPKGGTSKEERKKFFEEWGIETHSDLELEDEEEEESRT
jgi:DnaD/phage-associated family protein